MHGTGARTLLAPCLLGSVRRPHFTARPGGPPSLPRPDRDPAHCPSKLVSSLPSPPPSPIPSKPRSLSKSTHIRCHLLPLPVDPTGHAPTFLPSRSRPQKGPPQIPPSNARTHSVSNSSIARASLSESSFATLPIPQPCLSLKAPNKGTRLHPATPHTHAHTRTHTRTHTQHDFHQIAVRRRGSRLPRHGIGTRHHLVVQDRLHPHTDSDRRRIRNVDHWLLRNRHAPRGPRQGQLCHGRFVPTDLSRPRQGRPGSL